MKDQDIPLWGSISHYHGRFTLHYAKRDSSADIRLEGYNMDVFKDCPSNLPIVRFDLANIESVFSWLNQNYLCLDYSNGKPDFWCRLDLQDYIGTFAGYGIPVEELRITRGDADPK
jgi:hypothetical protein